jgi:UDP-N-acetylmuramoyl-tripeptide--D-alanyl-D-alanine ligase
MNVTGDRDLIPAQSVIASLLGENVEATVFDADSVGASAPTAIGFGLSDGLIRGSDVELTRTGTRFVATTAEGAFTVRTPLLGEAAVYAALAVIAAATSAGRPIAPVIDALGSLAAMGERRMAPSVGPHNSLVIDDSFGATRADTASALRSLAQITEGRGRSIAVLGALDSDASMALEDHQAIGLLLVRLNVRLLVAVGHGTRQLHSAAELEGSWDGEALNVGTPQEAYDLLCDYTRENDVVLVKGARADVMHPTANLLIGGAA